MPYDLSITVSGPPSGGTIEIIPHHTNLQVAPDGVGFSVDLSEATFDTAGPTGAAVYDARLHDLTFLWDFGDDSDMVWGAPVNLLPAFNNRNFGLGPFVTHVYRNPGTYTVTLTVLEPSSGKTATATYEHTVADPDLVYAGTKTVVVNPLGDTDFSEKPIGATEINADSWRPSDAVWTNLRLTGQPVRLLFKRGCSFDVGMSVDSGFVSGFFAGAYGTGAKPAITGPQKESPNTTDANNGVLLWVRNTFPVDGDFRVSGLNLYGDYDPVTESLTTSGEIGRQSVGVSLGRGVRAVVSEVDFTGFINTGVLTGQDAGEPLMLVVDDCSVNDGGGQYPGVFAAPSTDAESIFSLTGNRLAQPDDSVNDENETRAMSRNNYTKFSYYAGNDVYDTDVVGPCIKVQNRNEFDGAVNNIHGNCFEAGYNAIDIGMYIPTGASNKRMAASNTIIDGNVMISGPATASHINSQSTGLTIRNNLMITPSTPFWPGSGGLKKFIHLQEAVDADDRPASVTEALNKVYNNTLVNLRAEADNNGYSMIPVDDRTKIIHTALTVRASNNVLHQPNLNTPVITFAPLTGTPLFTPRCIGVKNSTSFILDTAYATPTGEVLDYRPDIGSAALGAAITGDVAYRDILTEPRPEPPSKGAWEAV